MIPPGQFYAVMSVHCCLFVIKQIAEISPLNSEFVYHTALWNILQSFQSVCVYKWTIIAKPIHSMFLISVKWHSHLLATSRNLSVILTPSFLPPQLSKSHFLVGLLHLTISSIWKFSPYTPYYITACHNLLSLRLSHDLPGAFVCFHSIFLCLFSSKLRIYWIADCVTKIMIESLQDKKKIFLVPFLLLFSG